MYRGIWNVIVVWLRIPSPPALQTGHDESVERFHPAPGFLNYLKFWFWLGLIPMDVAITVGWIVLMFMNPLIGVVIFPVALFVAVAPDVILYIAIHLRFDNTWYVLSDRSMRLRRGVWNITEVTITYENVQNVKVKSGPLQRAFGISDVIIETAGSGESAVNNGRAKPLNQGLIEGVSDASRIRDLIMRHVRASRSAGLGDEKRVALPEQSIWTSEHIATLRDIRDELVLLNV